MRGVIFRFAAPPIVSQPLMEALTIVPVQGVFGLGRGLRPPVHHLPAVHGHWYLLSHALFGRPLLSEPSRSLTRFLIASPPSSGIVSWYGSMAGGHSRSLKAATASSRSRCLCLARILITLKPKNEQKHLHQSNGGGSVAKHNDFTFMTIIDFVHELSQITEFREESRIK